MKKHFLMILLSVSLMASTKADAQVTLLGSNGLARDSVTNTASETWTGRAASQYSSFNVQVTITKVSGTVGGTLALIYSNDGTNYFTYAGDSTITPADASGTYGWRVINVSAPYIGVKYTGTGTMVASAVASVTGRKTN